MSREDPTRADTRDRFDQVAGDYDTRFVRFMDRYDEMQAVLVAVMLRLGIPLESSRVLDLGTGTGELARRVLEAAPGSRVHGVDFSTRMLDVARRKLACHADRFTSEIADLATYTPAPASFDLVVSGLAIHHLRDEAKRGLFIRLAAALRPGGAFLDGDLIKGDSPTERDVLEALGIESMRERGFQEAEIQERLERHRRHDVPSTIPEQGRWLLEAGFREVWVPWRHLSQAITVALR